MKNYMEEILRNMNFNQRKPIREIVYECLKKAIIFGVIPRGERIVEKEYISKFRISRTPFREALSRLEMEDLVEYVPKVGVVVKGITFEDIFEIYKIRQSFEVMVTEAVIENITCDEIREIDELLDLTEQKNKEGDIEEVIRLFDEFHTKIFEVSRLKRSLEIMSKINEYLQVFLNITLSNEERRKAALSEHRETLRAIAERDKLGAEKIVRNHIDNSLDIVIKDLSK